MKRIILCADDYGQSHAISQAIIELVRAKRLSAISCMVTTASWPVAGSHLQSYRNDIDMGLHFNLTEGENFQSLSRLLLKSYLRILNKNIIRAELNTQLDQFIDITGMLPDFIDGHQHIHQFPLIRDVLLEVYEKRLREHGCYVRSVYNLNDWWGINHSAYTKKIIIQSTGAAVLRKKLLSRNIPHNGSFAGVYSLKPMEDYANLFGVFLKNIQHGGLVMCHPGLVDDQAHDVIGDARFAEYAFIRGKHFLQLLAQRHVQLARFKEL